MKRFIACIAVFLFLASARESSAFLWWRDNVASSWATKAVQVDGTDDKWSGVDEINEPQVDVRAMNDGASVYLRIAADGMDGRAALSGFYRQDVTVWFLGPDGKTRKWGIRFPFSMLDAPPPSATMRGSDAPPLPDLDPILVTSQGVAISTSPLPQFLQVKLAMSGKDPVIEIGVPLDHLVDKTAKAVPFDIETSSVTKTVQDIFRKKSGARQKQASEGSESSSSDSGGSDSGWSSNSSSDGTGTERTGASWGGNRGGRTGGRGGRTRTGGADEVAFPDSLDLTLSVKLAPAPSNKS